MIYKGKNLRLSFDGKPIYHATSCKLSISVDLEEIATKDTDGKVSTPDAYTYSVTSEALVADAPEDDSAVGAMDIVDLAIAKTEIDVEFTTGVTGAFVYSGKVWCTQADIDATVGAAASGSFSFSGNGNLTKSVVPAP